MRLMWCVQHPESGQCGCAAQQVDCCTPHLHTSPPPHLLHSRAGTSHTLRCNRLPLSPATLSMLPAPSRGCSISQWLPCMSTAAECGHSSDMSGHSCSVASAAVDCVVCCCFRVR